MYSWNGFIFHEPPPFWLRYEKQAWKLQQRCVFSNCKLMILAIFEISFIIVNYNIYIQFLYATIQRLFFFILIWNTIFSYQYTWFYQKTTALHISEFTIIGTKIIENTWYFDHYSTEMVSFYHYKSIWS